MERRAPLAGLARRAAHRARARQQAARPGRARWPTTGSRPRVVHCSDLGRARHDRRDHRRARSGVRAATRIPGCASAAAASGRAHRPTRSTSAGPGMREAWRRGEITAPPGGEDDDDGAGPVRRRDRDGRGRRRDAGAGRDPPRRAAPGRDPRRRADVARPDPEPRRLLVRRSSGGDADATPSPSPTSPPPPSPRRRITAHRTAPSDGALGAPYARTERPITWWRW